MSSEKDKSQVALSIPFNLQGNLLASPTFDFQETSTPFKLGKFEDPGMNKSFKEKFKEPIDDYDRMHSFKFYFVNNNCEKVLNKFKKKVSPMRKSRRSQKGIPENMNPAKKSRFRFFEVSVN